MAELLFEGALENVTQFQVKFITGVIEKRGLKAKKVRVELLGEAGDNYGANVKKVVVELEDGGEFKMIVKIAPDSEFFRNLRNIVGLFKNEYVTFKEVLPTFDDLQKTARLSPDDIFRFPECYGASLEPYNEIVLLEDLSELNLRMLDRFTPLTNEAVRLILENFAKFHSLSYALQKQDPGTFDSYKDKFEDIYSTMKDNPVVNVFFNNIEEDTAALLDSDKHKKAVRGTVSKLMDMSTKVIKDGLNSRFSVVNHGDAWTNNVMFRLEDNVPVEAMLIDYQLARVVSPVNDLEYMIFNCTDYETRRKHYYEWIDYYHSELDKCLSNFGLKASYCYPRDQLDADLKRHAKLYLATVIMATALTSRKTEDAAEMKENMEQEPMDDLESISASMQVSKLDPESVALFKKKIGNVIESYIDFGYID